MWRRRTRPKDRYRASLRFRWQCARLDGTDVLYRLVFGVPTALLVLVAVGLAIDWLPAKLFDFGGFTVAQMLR